MITLLGDSNITHEAGPEYVDAGARWNDSVDGNGTADANGTVNSQVPGIYLITYTYTDSSGNPAVPVTRTIQVVDTTAPVITLIGDENVTLEAGFEYLEMGANWSDLVDGNGTAWLSGWVDHETPGFYTVQYDYMDSSGNQADSVIRTVSVTNQAPLEILPDNNLTFYENLEVGTKIANFTALDPDQIHHIQYSFVELDSEGNVTRFALDIHGTLTTNASFDYETDPTEYRILVKATDEHNESIESEFLIKLLDVYENRPPESLIVSNLSIAENLPAGSVVGIVEGFDPDLNDTLTYRLSTMDSHGVKDHPVIDLDEPFYDTSGDDILENHDDSILEIHDTDSDNLSGEFYDRNHSESDILQTYLSDKNSSEDPLVYTESIVEDSPDTNSSDNLSLFENDHNYTEEKDLNNTDLENADIYDQPIFYLDSNGSLQTTRPLDFETDPIFTELTIRVEDQDGTYYEESFVVELINVIEDLDSDGIEDPYDQDVDGDGYTNEEELLNGTSPEDPYSYTMKPIMETGEGIIEDNGSIQLFGKVNYTGNGLIEDFGFVVSSGISLDKSRSTVYWVRGVGEPSSFTLQSNQSPFPNTLYYRAWAKNAAGYGIGPVKKIIIPEAPQTWWGEISEEHGEWKTSTWFGHFIYYEKGWLYHAKLGWLYSSSDENGGVWLWDRNQGWLWTKEDVWPYLYKHQTNSWLYFTTSQNAKPIFYDYQTGTYIGLEKQSVPQTD